MDDPKDLLLGAMNTALAAVHGRVRVTEFLRRHPLAGPVGLFAVGKAAAAMAQGAVDVLGPQIVSGLVVSKRGLQDRPVTGDVPLMQLEAGHPLPDEDSLRAGRLMLEQIARLPADAAVLFLLSGGASSLVEVLPEGVALGDLHRLNDWLLASGWAISAMNGLRKRLSCIKGGRLAQRLAGHRTCNLLISDVPGDDPATIGSGPLVADAGGPPRADPPAWVQAMLGAAPPMPAADDPCFAAVRTHVIAASALARQAAVRYARANGCPARSYRQVLTGDFQGMAATIAERLLRGAPGLHVWGGESTVRLPPAPGRGGRNQSLALAVAARIKGDPRAAFVSVGSDGNDGNTTDAGALVDGATVAAGAALGMGPDDYIRRADAGTYLERIGALIHTGATGTNVMDLMIGLSGSVLSGRASQRFLL